MLRGLTLTTWGCKDDTSTKHLFIVSVTSCLRGLPDLDITNWHLAFFLGVYKSLILVFCTPKHHKCITFFEQETHLYWYLTVTFILAKTITGVNKFCKSQISKKQVSVTNDMENSMMLDDGHVTQNMNKSWLSNLSSQVRAYSIHKNISLNPVNAFTNELSFLKSLIVL